VRDRIGTSREGFYLWLYLPVKLEMDSGGPILRINPARFFICHTPQAKGSGFGPWLRVWLFLGGIHKEVVSFGIERHGLGAKILS
jgi:hypothetical protein